MLRILGLIFLALVAAAGITLGIWIYQDRQARDFIIATTPTIYTDWNAEALTHRSAGPLRTPDFEAKVEELFRTFGPHLGPLESAEPPEGWLNYGRADASLPSGLYGKYKSHARFRKGEAELEFVVIREQGAWRIASFRIESPAVLEAMKKQPAAKNAGPDFLKGPPDEEVAVRTEAEAILQLMDSEDPGASWHLASLQFQEARPKRRFLADMDRMRKSTGNLQSRQLQGIGFRLDFQQGKPPGDYAVADFVSTYSRATVEERLGFYRKEGKWLFSAHQWRRVDQ